MPWDAFVARPAARSSAVASSPVTDRSHRDPGISGLTPDELAAWVDGTGEPAYRARQIADAVWTDGGVTDADDDPHAAGRRSASALDADFRLDTVGDTEIRLADGGLTEKALHRLDDGALIEIGADALPGARRLARAAHAVHLEPGRLRGRLPVLRHRRARLRARPRGRRDRRPGPPRRSAGWRPTASG